MLTLEECAELRDKAAKYQVARATGRPPKSVAFGALNRFCDNIPRLLDALYEKDARIAALERALLSINSDYAHVCDFCANGYYMCDCDGSLWEFDHARFKEGVDQPCG